MANTFSEKQFPPRPPAERAVVVPPACGSRHAPRFGVKPALVLDEKAAIEDNMPGQKQGPRALIL